MHLRRLYGRSGGCIDLAAARRLCYQSPAGREAGPLPGLVTPFPSNLLSYSSHIGISDQLGRGARWLVESIKTAASRLPSGKYLYRASDL